MAENEFYLFSYTAICSTMVPCLLSKWCPVIFDSNTLYSVTVYPSYKNFRVSKTVAAVRFIANLLRIASSQFFIL
jgi:CRISPR/Cas system-associated endonuclease Cas1